MKSNIVIDPAYDPSTKQLDKWRFMFHIFNLATLTVAAISFGVSIATYTTAPPYPANVKDYAMPMIYYGINSFALTSHASFGALACVKGNLILLKSYAIIGYILVIEEIAFGSWIAATINSRVGVAIDEIRQLEYDHRDVEHTIKKRSNKDEDASGHKIHSIYKQINEYYECCMYANEWIEENKDFKDIYTHCLTEGDYFCGIRFIFFPGGNMIDNVKEKCNCEVKVKSVIQSRIVRQSTLMFLALPCQILCLICVAFFIKFEITVRNNIVQQLQDNSYID